jgi:hypothetical protein
MIVECEAGHRYENIPVTQGFHDIPKRCHICGANLVNVKLTHTSTISGAGGFAGMPPPSEWSTQPPTKAGWYWYKEAEKTLENPIAARIFWDNHVLHASMFFSQSDPPRQEIGQLKEFPGEWSGPVEMQR